MATKSELPVVGQTASGFEADAATRGMNRRQMVRNMLAGAGAGVALPAFAATATHPIHKHLTDISTLAEAEAKAAASDWQPLFLDPHQNASLIVLAERIVPGSTAAKSNQFIDLLLSVDTREAQQGFINAVSAFDAASLKAYGAPFKDLTEAQQNELLTTASTLAPGIAGAMTLRDQFEHLKGWVSGAYYSSEIGMKELGYDGNYFYDSFPGCTHPDGHKS